MVTTPRVTKIGVTLSETLQGTVNWSEEGQGAFVCEVHGVPVYNGSPSLREHLIGEGESKFYVLAKELEDVIFTDTYKGTLIMTELNLNINLTDGITEAALSYVSNYGTHGRCDVLNEVREAIISALKFNLLEAGALHEDGIIYPIKGYYVMIDSSKLYVLSGVCKREFA